MCVCVCVFARLWAVTILGRSKVDLEIISDTFAKWLERIERIDSRLSIRFVLLDSFLFSCFWKIFPWHLSRALSECSVGSR